MLANNAPGWHEEQPPPAHRGFDPLLGAPPFLPPSGATLQIESKGFRMNGPGGRTDEFAFQWQQRPRSRAPAAPAPEGEG